jgi:hypothetical protein
VAFDKPIMYNRLGAGNVNGMMFALARDTVSTSSVVPTPLQVDPLGKALGTPGNVDLRPDKRHRPLVLRVRVGDCLKVNLTNLLTPAPNPFNFDTAAADFTARNGTGQVFPASVDDQVAERRVGFHSSGLELVGGIADDGSNVGANPSSLAVSAGGFRQYTLYAPKEGVFVVSNPGASFGSDANQGNASSGLFGQVIVEPRGAEIYRSQVFEEELRLATTSTTSRGQPVLNYEATYPAGGVWASEGKAGLPVLNTMKCANSTACEIVHSEINAIVAYKDATGKLGSFPASTYPLESKGKRNPSLPNRLEPFRDFASIFHDEAVNSQAFPAFYVPKFAPTPVMPYVLAGVKDAFMINYGSGGIGSEIIANRLGVGPMHDCLNCAYEEFFLTSFTVGDPALTVDVPANVGLELCGLNTDTNQLVNCPANQTNRMKANYVIGAEDPSNVHHSYTGDFVKFRNTHNGKEQHVFHLHNHQWLYNPNDDNSNYLDAQGIGPGAGYTYEINFGGSGNRNKSAGDAIFHCHFYPHFAQGMWYHWRHNDTLQTGTVLNATPNTRDAQGYASAAGYHATPWALGVTTPAAGARAYPDGEIVAGTPIPALVPLPGKPMPPMPGRATVQPKIAGNGAIVGSNAKVIDRNLNPGFPFWVAGMEVSMGQRPPTPPLDMLSAAKASALKASGNALWANLSPAQADGWDGGLPRHTLQGVADGGEFLSVISPIDFSKVMHKAKPVYFPEEGTDLEQVAMAFHGQREHPSCLPDGTCDGAANKVKFLTNGSGGPVVGAPFHNPCIDDSGAVLRAGVVGKFYGPELTGQHDPAGLTVSGSSVFNSDTPRIYKGTNLQYDAVLNKVGYHYPQQRIVALWEDVGPVIAKNKPAEPLVMRLNTFDCAVYHHSNLVPEAYELDDYQVRTPTDIIGQHIHLPKWDLTTTDGAANGWNYEDGTLSPGAVRERIHAINAWNTTPGHTPVATLDGRTTLAPLPHPYFASVAGQLDGTPVGTLPAREGFAEAWLGARTTIQRWFADPVVNTDKVDRGLGIIFTHDHYGPSSHQQIGLYSTVLAEPAGSRWVHNETGSGLGCNAAVNAVMPSGTTAVNNAACRYDGGPTSWQAAILPQPGAPAGASTLEPFREFYFEYSDFQHAYEAGVYVGTNQMGLPLAGTGPGNGAVVGDEGNAQFDGAAANAFRFAINPPMREQINPVFPELFAEVAGGVDARCPTRPCPQAIDVQDPGILAVNYRHEPVALRIFDPAKLGPDGKPGMQADGLKGDLAFALQSRTDRAIAALNVQPDASTVINGTRFPPPINVAGVKAGDPFTPMIRTYIGDTVRVKMQAGGHEEEHNATIHGVKWLQAGSGHGKAPNSGWRNAQAGGISEQFTLTAPVVPAAVSLLNGEATDYLYSMDAGNDGWWSGMWGIMRAYNLPRADLFRFPGTLPPVAVTNALNFRAGTLCPSTAPLRTYDVSAVLANDVLGKPATVTIPTNVNPTTNVGGTLKGNGGTLVYNHRNTTVGGQTIPADLPGEAPLVLPTHQGPLHDPTAILYVRTADLAANGKLKAGVPVEPLVIRANAGDCVQVTLRNRLPVTAPDLPTYSMIQGVVKRDRFHPEGSTTFQVNLFRPSSHAGLTPQLAAYDIERDIGTLIGENPVGSAIVPPGGSTTYNWYAGHLEPVDTTVTIAGQVLPATRLDPTPVEFGGSNLMPADKVKQGAKSMVGTMVVQPQGSTWSETTQVLDRQAGSGTRLTRAQATVCPSGAAACSNATAGSFRDFSLVLTKGLTQYYRDGSPVEHMNGEGVGIPEDSQEASGMAVNYGVEPMWFRFGLVPQAPFGFCGGAPGCYGSVPNAGDAYSNALVGGDPATPVLQAVRNKQARIHLTNPYGTTRGSTFSLHGHVWQRDPYVCNGEARNALTGACLMSTVGSRNIGTNPMGFAQGGQESWNAPTHFDVVLPSAGGGNGVIGDFLFRDHAAFGNASGVWGLMRVQ